MGLNCVEQIWNELYISHGVIEYFVYVKGKYKISVDHTYRAAFILLNLFVDKGQNK